MRKSACHRLLTSIASLCLSTGLLAHSGHSFHSHRPHDPTKSQDYTTAAMNIAQVSVSFLYNALGLLSAAEGISHGSNFEKIGTSVELLGHLGNEIHQIAAVTKIVDNPYRDHVADAIAKAPLLVVGMQAFYNCFAIALHTASLNRRLNPVFAEHDHSHASNFVAHKLASLVLLSGISALDLAGHGLDASHYVSEIWTRAKNYWQPPDL